MGKSQKISKFKFTGYNSQCNNGFWDKPAEERAQAMESACNYYGVANFFDLEPEERSRAYDRD